MKAETVSQYLISKAQSSSGQRHVMSQLKLHKLLFYCQGWYLANYNSKLFKEDIYAWRYGPVVKDIYHEYSDYGSSNLALKVSVPAEIEAEFTNEQKSLLDQVWNQYGGLKAQTLVNMTHNSDPWLDAFSNPTSKVITAQSLLKFFGPLVKNG